MKLAHVLTTALAITLVGGSSLAQESNALAAVTFELLDASELNLGDSITISGAYLELLDEDVQLFGSPVDFVVRNPAVRRMILSHSATSRNLTFEAVKIEPKDERPTFEVTAARPAPDSRTVFANEIDVLRSRGKDGIDALLALAGRVRTTAKHFEDDSLEPAVKRACREALQIAEEVLAEGDVTSRLELVTKTHEACGDSHLAVELLTKLEKRYPDHEAVREQLRSIGARHFRGSWMTYDEFKKRQGFEKHGAVWVSKREKSFLETIFKLQTEAQDLIIRRRTAAEYDVLAKRGEVAMGMNPAEVVKAYGFADRVYHREFRGKSYDQWVYAGRFCYFEDGKLRRVASRTDDPTPR